MSDTPPLVEQLAPPILRRAVSLLASPTSTSSWPKIRVAEAAVLAHGDRDRLDDAVGHARLFGASWSAVADPAGMSKQAV